MREESAEVVVIGSGPAGYVCAIRLAQLGKKVTVIERGAIGGVCLNVGCIPSKALIHAGTTYEKMNHAESYGISVKGLALDLPKLMKWKESVVKKLTGGVSGLLKANGCKVIQGNARFTGAKTIEVDSQGEKTLLTFASCVIATGSRPSVLPGFEVDQKNVLDSTGALALDEVPKSLICIGGGYIGLELGTFYAKVGCKVTVVEAMDGILSGVDPELAKVVQRGLEKRGVEVMLKTKVKSLKKGKDVTVTVTTANGDEKNITADKVLVTIGRTPNSDQLGLESTGIKIDAKGFILVDPMRRTTLPNIYAIGDVAGQPLLAHKGSKEGLVVAEVIAGHATAYDVAAMPAVIFTDPEIATTGLTEAEARARGIQVNVAVFPFIANGRALSVGESDGFVKLVSDKNTGVLLGAHVVGPDASNLIAEPTLAIELGALVEDLALTVHAHPTLPEAIMEAAEVAMGHAIHIFQKKAPTVSAHPQANA